MFKLVVLSCIVSVAFAGIISAPATIAFEKTIVEPHSTIVETPTISHVGSVVKSIPTAHSYQSQTQYHSKTIAEPILAHGVQKTVVSSPIVKQYVEEIPAVVPVAKVVAEPQYITSYAAPLKTVAYQAAPAVAYHGQYAAHAAPVYAAHAAPVYAAHAAPLAYSSAVYAPKALSYSLPAASYAHHW